MKKSLKVIIGLAMASSLTAFAHAQGWYVVAKDGPFSLSAPISITMGTNDFKPLHWTILNYDLFQNSTGAQASMHNTHANYTVGWLGSYPNSYSLTSYDNSGVDSSETVDGYDEHNGVSTSSGTPGIYTIKIIVSDSAGTPATDNGPLVDYVTVTVN